MHPGLNEFIMRLRMESKKRENQSKPPIASPDVVETADFMFSPFCPLEHDGDSGSLYFRVTTAVRRIFERQTVSPIPIITPAPID